MLPTRRYGNPISGKFFCFLVRGCCIYWRQETGEGAAMELGNKKCIPCEGGATTLPAGEVNRMLSQLSGWQVEPGVSELRKRYKFASFLDTMAFVNRMAELAEAEGHHPDFCVRYTNLDVSLTTHAIGGLSENDFILAAKIEFLPKVVGVNL